MTELPDTKHPPALRVEAVRGLGGALGRHGSGIGDCDALTGLPIGERRNSGQATSPEAGAERNGVKRALEVGRIPEEIPTIRGVSRSAEVVAVVVHESTAANSAESGFR